MYANVGKVKHAYRLEVYIHQCFNTLTLLKYAAAYLTFGRKVRAYFQNCLIFKSPLIFNAKIP